MQAAPACWQAARMAGVYCCRTSRIILQVNADLLPGNLAVIIACSKL